MKGRFPRRRLFRIVATNTFRYLFRGAARNWARNIGSTAPALGSMTLLLVMTGLVGITAFALHNLERVETAQASLLHVYIRDDAAPVEVDWLRDRLQNDPRVASVSYTSKSQALARAQRMPGLPELADATESNPFPASLDVQLKSIDDVAGIDAMARDDGAVDPLYPTSYDRGAYRRIQAVLFGTAVAGFALLSMLGFVAVTVTINSIKAAIHARRDEISIMQLVGAPRWMVRGPFVVEGAITGGLAGMAAGLVTFGLAMTGIAAGSGTFTQFAPGVTAAVAAVVGAMVFAAGLGLGSGSSLVSVRRHMEA
ncbi:MAG: FtsX-like permease family protein [Chloroflexi bacterium]|nr:MAG: FtsX-like permease family protein [Chloroflexota bacterium]TMF78587.1 MAG: FtsX-like permease family protein [Chloroflexota bacterium]TMG45913.1 MAG: FtsX-like permease family protein [Chloroflexota bacterium]